MDNRYEIAEQNGMSREFADWFFDNKKAGCGNVWFMMMAAMWEGWQGRASMLDNCTTVELRGHAGCRTKNGLNCHAMLQGADGNSPVIPDWQTKAEKMAEIHGTSFVVFRNGESPQCAEPSKVIISFTDEGLGHGAEAHFREIVNSSTNNCRGNAETSTKCWCRTCRPVTISDMRFVVCPQCGNKRCPHANDHRNACTGSNEPGQEGSAYPAAPQQEVK